MLIPQLQDTKVKCNEYGDIVFLSLSLGFYTDMSVLTSSTVCVVNTPPVPGLSGCLPWKAAVCCGWETELGHVDKCTGHGQMLVIGREGGGVGEACGRSLGPGSEGRLTCESGGGGGVGSCGSPLTAIDSPSLVSEACLWRMITGSCTRPNTIQTNTSMGFHYW